MKKYKVNLKQTYIQDQEVTIHVESDLSLEELENEISEITSGWRIARLSEAELIRTGKINGYVKGSYSTWDGDYDNTDDVTTFIEELNSEGDDGETIVDDTEDEEEIVAEEETVEEEDNNSIKSEPNPKRTKREPNPAFMEALNVSPELETIVGKGPMPRTEVVSKLWDYIKKNNLQDLQERTNINADANLQKVFEGKKQVTMFEMTKLVSKHLS